MMMTPSCTPTHSPALQNQTSPEKHQSRCILFQKRSVQAMRLIVQCAAMSGTDFCEKDVSRPSALQRS
eukprot:36390-Rhodomonas_salina.2